MPQSRPAARPQRHRDCNARVVQERADSLAPSDGAYVPGAHARHSTFGAPIIVLINESELARTLYVPRGQYSHAVAPGLRDPATGLTLRELAARLGGTPWSS